MSRKIDPSFISSSAQQPFTQGTWVHLQQAYQEGLSSLSQMIIGLSYGYDPTKVYVVYGMAQAVVASVLNITAGAIFYNGEIYLFTAQSIHFPAANNFILNLSTAYYTDPTADPVLFTDGNTHNVHVIRTAIVADATGNGTISNDANSALLNLIYPVAKTTLSYKIMPSNASAFPVYINFQKDVILAVTSAVAGANTINIDFTNAISGTKYQVITYVNTGATFSLSYSGTPIVSLVSGSLSAPAVGTNLIEFTYRGKPFGNDFLAVSITLQP